MPPAVNSTGTTAHVRPRSNAHAARVEQTMSTTSAGRKASVTSGRVGTRSSHDRTSSELNTPTHSSTPRTACSTKYAPAATSTGSGRDAQAVASSSPLVSSSSMRSSVAVMFFSVCLAPRRTIGFVKADSWVMSHDSRTRVPPSTGSSS